MTLHNKELMACSIEETENELIYSFIIQKDLISKIDTSLLNYQNNMSSHLKLQQVILNNLEVSINQQITPLTFTKTTEDKSFFILQFSSKKPEKVEKISLKNNGFSFLNEDHTSFDFWILLNNQKRLFKLKKETNIIKANYTL